MKQIVVISGKGGTGKTTLIASLISLASPNVVLADCDVDAPDLHLIIDAKERERKEFYGMKKAVIDRSICNECGLCQDTCRFDAITDLKVDPLSCEGCGLCANICPTDAITMRDQLSGYAYISDTRFGPMAHAILLPGEEASGKLVTLVREMSQQLAKSYDKELILIDGSPGIGCPVIASLTGSDIALIITEPTISGVHDLDRIIKVVDFFGIVPLVCINKYDLNLDMTSKIEELCKTQDIEIVGKLPYDTAAFDAMVKGIPVVEMESPLKPAILSMWEKVSSYI